MQSVYAPDIETLATNILIVEEIAVANDGRTFISTEADWIYLIAPNGYE